MRCPLLRELPTPPPTKRGWPWTEGPVSAASSNGGQPRVSIVTPSFNQAGFLEETIRSVLLQGYADLEYFVIDGGSTDHSVNIIRKYEPWLASWVSEPDRGQSHAINKGLFRATGEYFNYINSDDVLAPGALAAVAEGFAAHSSADFIHGKCVIGDASGRATSVRQGSGRDFADMFVNLLAGNGLHPLTVFYRREAVVRVGGFREHLEQEMDADLWFRLLDAGCQIGTIGACLGTFRCHPNQKSVSPRRIDELLTVMLEAIERHRGFSDRERHELSRRASQRCARQKLWAASSSFQSGRYRDYGRCCARAVQMDPLVMGSWVFWTNVSAPIKPLIPKSLADFARRHARHPTSSAAG